MIQVKRVYDPSEPGDGTRFLVERLWARGMKKAALHLDGWLKEAAPSDALRRWFGHDPAKWQTSSAVISANWTANRRPGGPS